MADWNPENSLTEPELALAARKGWVKAFVIQQVEDGYIVTLKQSFRQDIYHLATRRKRDEPKVFKHIGRLIEHVQKTYPKVRHVQLEMLKQTKDAVKGQGRAKAE